MAPIMDYDSWFGWELALIGIPLIVIYLVVMFEHMPVDFDE